MQGTSSIFDCWQSLRSWSLYVFGPSSLRSTKPCVSFLNSNPFFNPVIPWASATTQGSKLHNLLLLNILILNWGFSFCLNLLLLFLIVLKFWIVNKFYIFIFFKLFMVLYTSVRYPPLASPFSKSRKPVQSESQSSST